MRTVRFLAVVLVVLAMLFVSAHGASKRPEASRVVELTRDNYEEYIHGHMRHTFVLYCVKWSRQCEAARTMWDRLSMSQSTKELRDIFTAAFVDGDKYPDIIEKMGVNGFPTTTYYTPVYPEGVEYRGSRELFLLDSFVFQYS